MDDLQSVKILVFQVFKQISELLLDIPGCYVHVHRGTKHRHQLLLLSLVVQQLCLIIRVRGVFKLATHCTVSDCQAASLEGDEWTLLNQQGSYGHHGTVKHSEVSFYRETAFSINRDKF